jgi:hypothetical protein
MSKPSLKSSMADWRVHLQGPINTKFLFNVAFFFANFFIAKIIIYASPLLIAAIATGAVYGSIELAQSFGLLITSFIVGAPLAGLTQNYLIRGDSHVMDQLAAIAVIFCGLTLFAYAVAWALGIQANVQLIIVSFATAVIHNVAATWFRNRAARNLTAWVDGTAGILAVLMVLISFVLVGSARIDVVTNAYLIFAIISTIIAGALLIYTATSGLGTRLIESTRIGIPMVIVGTMATWLGVGGRMTVGVLDEANVAAYGVAFRVAGLALGFHQLAVTGLFAKLYRARTREADFIISMFLVAVGMLLCGIGFCGTLIVTYFDFEALDANARTVFTRILPITCVQTFFWIGYAMLQMRINRTGMAGKSIIPTAIVMFGGITIIFAAGHFAHIGIETLCWLIALHAACFFFVSVYMLAVVRRLPHVLMMRSGVVGGVVLSAVAVIGNQLT